MGLVDGELRLAKGRILVIEDESKLPRCSPAADGERVRGDVRERRRFRSRAGGAEGIQSWSS